MGEYLQKAKEAYEKANEIAGRSVKNVREFTRAFDQAKGEILRDRMLSDVGKKEKLEELKQKMGREFMKKLSAEKSEYQENIVKAIENAKRALAEPFKKPHDVDLRLHEREMKQIKMQAAIGNKRVALEKLEEYAEKVNDPYIADQMMDALIELLDHFNLTDEEMQRLKRVYETLESVTLTEEKREAQRILDATDGAFFRDLYNEIAVDAIKSRMGRDYARYVNEPELYLAKRKKEE